MQPVINTDGILCLVDNYTVHCTKITYTMLVIYQVTQYTKRNFISPMGSMCMNICKKQNSCFLLEYFKPLGIIIPRNLQKSRQSWGRAKHIILRSHKCSKSNPSQIPLILTWHQFRVEFQLTQINVRSKESGPFTRLQHRRCVQCYTQESGMVSFIFRSNLTYMSELLCILQDFLLFLTVLGSLKCLLKVRCSTSLRT